jgi:nucleoid-associated protein YgaU
MPENQEKENEPQGNFSKDNLALIVGGIFVLALIFAAYSYFNRNSDIQDRIQRNADRIQDIISSNTTNEEEESEDESTATPTPTPSPTDRRETIGNGNGGTQGTVWTANDYQQGDIKGNSYTVVSGDTLWEIAEAVYGNGSQWTRILDANANGIGFLPNGQQALIVPGQVLVLP